MVWMPLGVCLVLFWPALFFMMGDDQEEELASLKGQYDALEQAAIQKDCDVADEIAERRASGRAQRNGTRSRRCKRLSRFAPKI